ncbi:MAG TPA: hypothetical protein VM427_00695 [Patescibacteria group bacterium]|nr:hypothetical protein [Patescibacteria group bacterium]
MVERDVAWLGRDPGHGDLAAIRELAVIWATVDLERVLRDLGLEPTLAMAAVDDSLLGGRVLDLIDPLAPAVGPTLGAVGAARIALAEPSTEGRLAAFLARHGEGPAGRYVGVSLDLAAIGIRAAAAGVSLSRPEIGPFGPAALVLGGPPGSPHLIVVEVTAVPSRP